MKFGHIAGDPLLDLLNTVEWRLSVKKRTDRLPGFDQVLDWCEESAVLTTGEAAALGRIARDDPQTAEAQRLRTIDARELTYRMLVEADNDAGQRLGQMFNESVARSVLVPQGTSWCWTDQDTSTLTAPADRIVRGLVSLTQRDDLDRLHQCEDAKCGWVYLDVSPRRNRRWCATSDCGDRNRARAYYARKKAAT